MNCGKNVRLNPMNTISAANFDQASGYMRPVILGHQKCRPPMNAITLPPTITEWKCATTKYVPCVATPVASVARNRPVNPPIVNNPIKPNAYSIGVSNETEPLYMVAVQLKTLIAEGTATMKLRNEKARLVYMLSPVMNI